MQFNLACPNVRFRGNGSETGADNEAKHPALVRFESLGFIFRPDGSGFCQAANVPQVEIERIEELMQLQVKANVLITIDGTTLIFGAP